MKVDYKFMSMMLAFAVNFGTVLFWAGDLNHRVSINEKSISKCEERSTKLANDFGAMRADLAEVKATGNFTAVMVQDINRKMDGKADK